MVPVEVEHSLSGDALKLLPAVISDPDEDTPRGMLVDALQECGRWNWPTVIGLVKRHPAADGVRYLAADWFDQHGQAERAEFIRVQIERWRWCNDDAESSLSTEGQKRHADISHREWSLWQRYGINWLPDIEGVTQKDIRDLHHGDRAMSGSLYVSGHVDHRGRIDCDFRRGFIDGLMTSAPDWVTRGDAILPDHPIREVNLYSWPRLGWRLNHHDRRMVVWLASAPSRRKPITCDVTREAMDGSYRWWPQAVHTLLYVTWPGITFRLPNMTMPDVPETWAEAVRQERRLGAEAMFNGNVVNRARRSLGSVADLIIEAASAEAHLQAEVRERVARDVIEHFGCSPGDATWVEDSVAGRIMGEAYRFMCECSSVRPLHLHQLDGPSDPTPFPLVTLTHFRQVAVDAPNRPRREWRSWAGRCDRCRRVYVAVREASSP